MSSSDTASGGLVTTVAGLREHAGADLGSSRWRTIDQSMVNAFADLTDDHNPVHVDPDFAAGTPFGGTIAHGFLSLSLLAPMSNELLTVDDASLSVNYGLDKVRFPAPVPVGAEIRTKAVLSEVAEISGGIQVKLHATVEVRGGDKPAVVADCVFRHYA